MKKMILPICLTAITALSDVKAQQTLTPELLWKFGRVSEPVVSPDGSKILYGVTNYDVAENKGNRDLYTVDVKTGVVARLTITNTSEYNAVWKPDGSKIAYLSAEGGSPQMWEMSPDGTSKKQVSNVADGIDGFAYSPKMDGVLFIKSVKMDKTARELYPDLNKVDARIIDGLMYRHWDSWDDFSNSHVFYASYNGQSLGEAKDIMQGEKFDSPLQPDGGMEQIAFSSDGKQIAYASKKLKGTQEAISTNADIYLYDIVSGTTQNISQGMEGYDLDPSFSPDGKMIAWLSMKTPSYESDKNRLIIMDLASKERRDVTLKFDQGVNNINWTSDSKNIYFTSATRGTNQVFCVNVNTNEIRQITQGDFDYSSMALTGKYAVAVKTKMSMPAELFKINLVTGKDAQLTHTNDELLSTMKMGKIESKHFRTSDGKDLQVWVIFPPNFDPNKKYPTLLYCQGGPQSMISQSFSYRWNFQLMAANGYIVVAPNRRGVPGFGQAWTDQIAADWGGQSINDYYTAIDSMVQMPYVNKDKLGAVGASYGGYSVYYMAGTHNKRFKAFIAHCGLYDLPSWYASTEEMFFANHDMGGAYWNQPTPTSYQKFSPSSMVGKWDTPILVIHNQKDYRVPVEQGMQAFGAAQLRGVPSQFLYFPDEGHWVNKPQNSILWNRVFFAWLDKWLK